MKYNKIRTVLIIVCIIALFSLSSCSKGENNTVNASVYASSEAMSLYLTGSVKNYFSKTSNYLFVSSDIDKTYEKMQQTLLTKAVNIAYIDASELSYVIKKSEIPISVVFIDCWQNGNIKGIWVAQNSWTKNSPSSYKSFVNGLVKSADYRAGNYTKTIADASPELKGEYKIQNYNDVGYYLAAYATSTGEKITETQFESKTAAQSYQLFKDYNKGEGIGYEKCLAIYNNAASSVSGEKCSFDEVFNLDAMIESAAALIQK